MLPLAFDAPSDSFWTGLGAVATVLAIPTALFIGWLGYRAVWPRRKVHWSARVSTLTHEAAHGALTISHGGMPLAAPHVVELEISNVGNKDVEPAHFNGQPVEVTTTADVVALLNEASQPSAQRVLRATLAHQSLYLSTATPLHRRQTMTYIFLVDGSDPTVWLRASVSNTSFEERAPATHGQRARLTQLIEIRINSWEMLTTLPAVVVGGMVWLLGHLLRWW